MAEFEGLHGFGQEVSPPDGPSPLGRRGYGSCIFCQSPDTLWQHDLNASLSTFRTTFGTGNVWADSHKLCDQCEQLYNAGEYAALARFQTTNPPSYQDELADHLIGLAAFCRADRGARALKQTDFPPGFEPWQEYTGADFVFGVWPENRRAVLNGVELVASPWPSLDLTTVFRVLWAWVEREGNHETPPQLMAGRAAQALAWTEADALRWLAEH